MENESTKNDASERGSLNSDASLVLPLTSQGIGSCLIPPVRYLDVPEDADPVLLTFNDITSIWIDDTNGSIRDFNHHFRLLMHFIHDWNPKIRVQKTRDDHSLRLQLLVQPDLILIREKDVDWADELNQQSYRLSISDATTVKIESPSTEGIGLGLQTFRQLLKCLDIPDTFLYSSRDSGSSTPTSGSGSSQSTPNTKKKRSSRKKRIPYAPHVLTDVDLLGFATLSGLPIGMKIEDYPDFPNRGFMLDISRNRVPKIESIHHIVDVLSSLKLNQLQLYTEHTFAYKNHKVVWENASPMTSEEISSLDQYCRERGVQLVPNQNSFGHMNRWLTHKEYLDLAEVPEGINHPFAFQKEPFSLCPILPETIDFLRGLYDELLPNFTSEYFNVGLDETFDLGMGRSAEECRVRGKEVVYLEYLHRVHKELTERKKKMMFWADIIVRKPELISHLPKDSTALIWGYEYDYPFDTHSRVFKENGIQFYVCPGTSSWASISGRTENCMLNIKRSAESGKKFGAKGYLLTDWGDNGHLQQFVVSLLPITYAGCCSWNHSSPHSDSHHLLRNFNRHIYNDRGNTVGALLFDMGNLYKNAVKFHVPNGSLLFWPLIFPLAIQKMPALKAVAREKVGGFGEWFVDNLGGTMIRAMSWFVGVDMAGLCSILEHIQLLKSRISFIQMNHSQGDKIVRQIEFTLDLLQFATIMTIERAKIGLDKDVGKIKKKMRSDMILSLETLVPKFRSLWLEDCKPGGLELSTKYLTNLSVHIRGKDLATRQGDK
ncbi:glycoside hydrolase [Planoprotostelium fungivorum]|uniref:beta-N-acetylhexosaminidase n=1 Tax=Planoprotostelium fungivorum TaxID=1890364 RepID=A0A2P6NWY5_9EUKA|nr:glycoside hydrolase [Planoprotostelium fungivorum]